MTKIRVLHIIKSLGRGGAETLLPQTLKLHDHEQFEFHYIYFLPWKDQLVAELKAAGGRVICFPAKNNIELILKSSQVAQYALEQSIDVIHAHLPWAGIAARRVGKLTGIPVIYTEHNKQERYHFITRWLNLATMNALSVIIGVSGDVSYSIKKHKPRLTAKHLTILNGVNTVDFKNNHSSEVRQQLSIPSGSIVIGTVAVFRHQKRLHLWLEIAAKLLAQKPDTHFIIVGDGPLKHELLRKLDNLQIASNVHFVGLHANVKPYLSAMDIFMMTSEFEGLPIALLEAMSFGLPVVSTKAGGIGEVVRHKQEGLICGVGQTEEIVKMAFEVANDESMRHEMGKAARARVEEEFSINRMIKQLEEVYKNLSTTNEK